MTTLRDPEVAQWLLFGGAHMSQSVGVILVSHSPPLRRCSPVAGQKIAEGRFYQFLLQVLSYKD
jgi:hypothetical protein